MTGPMMYMQYMMPVVFLFVMNSFPSGLSFYYFVSNIFTIGQQVLTKQFVDETKIREKLEKNKTTASTRKPNRFMQRMEEAMKETEKRKKK
jgi:YidC/Oxa1 family membrane protein insertase